MPIGRPSNTSETDEAILAKYPQVIRLLNLDYSLRKINKRTKVSINTIRKVRDILEKNRDDP